MSAHAGAIGGMKPQPLTDRPSAASNKPTNQKLHWRGPGFDVAMASDWCCPHCLRPLRPSAVRCDDAATRLLCELCHAELLTVEPLEG
jgi:hypothetical protein